MRHQSREGLSRPYNVIVICFCGSTEISEKGSSRQEGGFNIPLLHFNFNRLTERSADFVLALAFENLPIALQTYCSMHICRGDRNTHTHTLGSLKPHRLTYVWGFLTGWSTLTGLSSLRSFRLSLNVWLMILRLVLLFMVKGVNISFKTLSFLTENRKESKTQPLFHFLILKRDNV